MKSDDLRRAIGEIDDDLIENADKKPRSNARRNLKKWGMIAAALLLVIAAIFPLGIRIAKNGFVGEMAAYDLMEGIVPHVNSYDPAAVSTLDATEATDFAVRLFQSAYDGKNTLLSPLSVLVALSMTANGAEGETRAQMENVLGMTVSELNEFFTVYLKYLNNQNLNPNVELSLANSIWLRDWEGFSVKEAFLQTNADVYGAGAYRAPFDASTVRDVNRWVEENTDGMIKEIVERFDPDDVLLLVNALFLNAKWVKQFEKKDVEQDVFHLENGTDVNATFLCGTDHGYIVDGDRAVGFTKRYAYGDYGFAALLPNEGISVGEYLATLDGETVSALLSNVQHRLDVKIKLPKFKTSYEVVLNDVLAGMGMPDAFTLSADFSGITESLGGLYINEVRHKTAIDLNEKGTSATATTLIGGKTKGIPDEDPPTVVLDRPFVYLIYDTVTRMPLFIGVLNDPS